MDNNSENTEKKGITILKAVFFPIYLLAALFKLITGKIGFSIRLRMSLVYIRKLFGAMILAGLGIITVFGSAAIYGPVSHDYKSVSNILSEDNINYQELGDYSREQGSHIIVYDGDGNLLYETKTGLSAYKYKQIFDIGILNTGNNLFFSVSKVKSNAGEKLRTVILTEIKGKVDEVIHLSKIIFYVFAAVIVLSSFSLIGAGKGAFQPVRDMTETVKSISEKNLNLRLNVGGSKDELKELAITFNDMMNRIEEYYEKQKQFVSDASHELRTPIAVIQGYANMLDRWGKNDTKVLQESIDAIKNESESMKDLVEKLLFLARNDKGTLVLQKEEFSLTEMLIETVKETQIINNSHSIDCHINEEVSIYADRNRIKQAVRIFIDNAVKYTPQYGSITISLSRQNTQLSISIKDTGIGISKKELSHIFDRFYRSDKSRAKAKGGYGLGLAIAKIIILGHNGKIKVRSKPKEGSEFIILLPA